jgi:hypothetical protein
MAGLLICSGLGYWTVVMRLAEGDDSGGVIWEAQLQLAALVMAEEAWPRAEAVASVVV